MIQSTMYGILISLNNKGDNAYLKTWNNCILIFFTYIQYMSLYKPQSLNRINTYHNQIIVV